MPRYARMLLSTESEAIYHVVSRTALDGFPFGEVEKERFVNLLKNYSEIYFTEILGYAILDNHFHLVCKMLPDSSFSDDEIKQRFRALYGKDKYFNPDQIPHFRERWASLSRFLQELKQTFSRYYNKLHDRKGTLWAERFKSVIVENGETLVNCLAYVDLNPVRAGIVEKPEDYRWCSLGYHAQTSNKDGFLSMDFGMVEFGVKCPDERFRRYRKFVYEKGALDKHGQTDSVKIAPEILEKERNNNFEIDLIDRFRYRTRYFTDSGILGSKSFVYEHYQLFKDRFQSKKEKIPKKVKGLDGIFSLKQLSELS